MGSLLDEVVRHRAYRARVLDVGKAEAALREQSAVGEATILVSVFEVPDTDVSAGNVERQIIDRGAFQPYLESNPFPEPLFMDHGDALIRGHYSGARLLGEVRSGRETQEGFEIDGAYDLEDPLGRSAFGKVLRFPGVVSFSFANYVDQEKRYRARDGFEHISEIWPYEFSQTGIGAQELTRVVSARSAVGSHSTATSDDAWDGPANEARLPGTAETNRQAHAWRDPDGDLEAKASWKFIHHFVSDGRVGAASTRGCSNGIAVLNGGRGGSKIPDDDRSGVHAHLAKHLRDAGRDDVPALRTAEAAEARRELLEGFHRDREFMEAIAARMLDDESFREDVRRAVESSAAPAGDAASLADFYRELLAS